MFRSIPGRSVVVALALLAAACGSSGTNGASGNAPSASGGFVAGQFDTLPTLPNMHALGPENARGGVTTRSYKISGDTPHDAVLAYAQLLSRWHNSVGPHAVGSSVRGTWVSTGGSTLQVTAINAPTIDTSGSKELQMTLQLYTPSTPASTRP
jgi:hypothetical protein